MIVSGKLKAAMRGLKAAGWDRIEQWNQKLDDESVKRYIAKIMQEDGVTWEEAWKLCQTDPKYSMGLKMCSPAVIMMLTMRGGKARFRQMLTPEEAALFDSEVDGKINFRPAMVAPKILKIAALVLMIVCVGTLVSFRR